MDALINLIRRFPVPEPAGRLKGLLTGFSFAKKATDRPRGRGRKALPGQALVTAAAIIFFISPVNAQDPEDLIHLGDLVDVDVVGSTEFDWRGELTPEGFLSGIEFTEKPVAALCRTTTDVAAEIAGSYGRFLNRPEVRVSILDRSGRLPAVVFGAVRNQQRLRLLRTVNLAEIIVVSGGLTSRASGEITILRQPRASCRAAGAGEQAEARAEGKTVAIGESIQLSISVKDLLRGEPRANPEIQYGDVITVLETSPVYVMGGVANPQRVDFREGLTLSRAVASAGGTIKGADPGRITIFRRQGGSSEVIKADLRDIETGNKVDVVLSAYDIVDVALDGEPDRRYAPFGEVERTGEQKPSELPVRVID